VIDPRATTYRGVRRQEPPRLPDFEALRHGRDGPPGPEQPRDVLRRGNPSVTRRSTRHFTRATETRVEAQWKRWTAAVSSSGSAHPRPKRCACWDFTEPATGRSSRRVDGKKGVAGSSPAEGLLTTPP
jgi:hypothetical protein